MAFLPPLSIIIAVKNNKDHLKETLESIWVQSYPKLEVIVVDGNSTDGTLEVIESYHDVINRFISEPDEGISDAFNKGLKLATGEYINFQGAGDTLYSPMCLQELFKGLDDSYKLICGKVMRVAEDGKTPIWTAPKKTSFSPLSLLFKMSLPHQGLFTHRSFFSEFGDFDKSLKFSMDYELLLRAYHKFPKTIVREGIVSRWRAGGVGTNRISEIYEEYDRIKTQHKIASPFVLRLIHHFNHFKYRLKSLCRK